MQDQSHKLFFCSIRQSLMQHFLRGVKRRRWMIRLPSWEFTGDALCDNINKVDFTECGTSVENKAHHSFISHFLLTIKYRKMCVICCSDFHWDLPHTQKTRTHMPDFRWHPSLIVLLQTDSAPPPGSLQLYRRSSGIRHDCQTEATGAAGKSCIHEWMNGWNVSLVENQCYCGWMDGGDPRFFLQNRLKTKNDVGGVVGKQACWLVIKIRKLVSARPLTASLGASLVSSQLQKGIKQEESCSERQ